MLNQKATKWQSWPDSQRSERATKIVNEKTTSGLFTNAEENGWILKPIGGKMSNAGKIDSLASDVVSAIADGEITNKLESYALSSLAMKGHKTSSYINRFVRKLYDEGDIKEISLPEVIAYLFRVENSYMSSDFDSLLNNDLRIIRSGAHENECKQPSSCDCPINMAFYDAGLGINPSDAKDKLADFHSSDKHKIEFLTGMWGQGSFAGLKFTGARVRIFKENPNLKPKSLRNNQFGILVQFKMPTEPEEGRLPWTYMQFLDSDGSIPSFESLEGLPILPVGNGSTDEEKCNAYGAPMEYGVFTKYYDLDLDPGIKNSHIGDNFRKRLSVLWPELPIPITMQDRSRRWDRETTDVTLEGMIRKLHTDNLYEQVLQLSPLTTEINLDGEKASMVTYLLKEQQKRKSTQEEIRPVKNRTEYIPNQEYGILFVDNGQTHHWLPLSKIRTKLGGKVEFIYSDLIVVINTDGVKKSKWKIYNPSRTDRHKNDTNKELDKQIMENLGSDKDLMEENKRRQLEHACLVKPSRQNLDIYKLIDKENPKLIEGSLGFDRNTDPVIGPRDPKGKDKLADTQKYPTKFELEKGSEKKWPRELPANRKYSNVRCDSNAMSDYFSSRRGNWELKFNGQTYSSRDDKSDVLNVDITRSGIVNLRIKHIDEKDRTLGAILKYELTVWDKYDGRAHDERGSEQVPFIIKFSMKCVTVVKTQKPSLSAGSTKRWEKTEKVTTDPTPKIEWLDDFSRFGKNNNLQGVHLVEIDGQITIYLNRQSRYLMEAQTMKTKKAKDLIEIKFEVYHRTMALSTRFNNRYKDSDGEPDYKKLSEDWGQAFLTIMNFDKYFTRTGTDSFSNSNEQAA